MMNRLQKKLRLLEEAHRYRSLSLPKGIDLTSNDYLGLREHPALRAAAIEALQGGIAVGAGGSRLLRGHTDEHAALESFAAEYFGYERVLFFANGFQANYSIFTTLPDRHDTVIYDALLHASAKEGIHAGHADKIKVPHNDLNEYEDALRRAKKNAKGDLWVAVEALYSMDGDLAPLKELYALAQKYEAYLIVDEAHATGVFGANGKGLAEDLPRERLITVHTCGKALGVAGGLVCAEAEVIDALVNMGRPFVYSTAPMPLQALLVHKALEISRDEKWRRERLFALRDAANTALGMNSPSQILPVILGSDVQAVEVAQTLQAQGFDVRPIRPPTVPEGTARLRVSLSSSLDEKNISDFAAALTPLLQAKAA
jgi:8-amino-7-oxononanoate synthase